MCMGVWWGVRWHSNHTSRALGLETLKMAVQKDIALSTIIESFWPYGIFSGKAITEATWDLCDKCPSFSAQLCECTIPCALPTFCDSSPTPIILIQRDNQKQINWSVRCSTLVVRDDVSLIHNRRNASSTLLNVTLMLVTVVEEDSLPPLMLWGNYFLT